MRTALAALLAFLVGVISLAAGGDASWNQWIEKTPVSSRLQVTSGSLDVAESLVVRVEASVPSLSLEESLATGQPARFRPEPQLGDWLRIPHLNLAHIERREEPRPEKGVTVFHWTFRWEAELPGAYTLPALRMAFRPAKPDVPALETVFAKVPVTVASIIPGDPASAKPRPAVTALPASPQAALRWSLVVLTALLWAAFRFGYARWRKARFQPDPNLVRCSPGMEAIHRLRASRSALEGYQILRGFLLASAGIDLAKVPSEDLRGHPRLSETARRLLPPLVEELQPGAYSQGDALLPVDLRDRLVEFLSSSAP